MTLLIVAIIVVGQLTSIQKLPLLIMTLVIVLGILFVCNGMAMKKPDHWGAMKYPQLIYGMLGIFLYVGVEVTIDNNFGALLREKNYLTSAGLDESKISKYVSLYWASLMIGRWTGAIGVFNLSEMGKRIATVVVPFVAFGVALFVNHLYSGDVSDLYPYAAFVAIAIVAFFYGQQKPVKTLLTLALLAGAFILTGVLTTGYLVRLLHHGGGALQFDHVALYLLAWGGRAWEIYVAGLCIPDHDDPGRCGCSRRSRERSGTSWGRQRECTTAILSRLSAMWCWPGWR